MASFHIPPSALIAVKLLLLILDYLPISAILVISQFAFIRGQSPAFLRVSVVDFFDASRDHARHYYALLLGHHRADD